MGRLARAGILALAWSAATLAAGSARAEPTVQEVELARTLFAEGLSFEQKTEYTAALERFHRVATVKSTPSLKFHMGFCEEKLGHTAIALTYYQQAETEATQKNAQDVLNAVRGPLANLRAKVPKLVPVVTDAPDLEVSIDGKPIPKGLWGIEQRVDAGRHTVEGKAPGYAPFSQTLEFPEGSRIEVKVKVELAKQATATPATNAPPATDAPAATTQTAAPSPPPHDGSAESPTPATVDGAADTSQPRRSRTIPIVATAGAVVLVTAGFASFFYAGGLADDAKTYCLTVPNCDAKKGDVRLFDALALSGWIAGAGLGAVAVIMWTSGGSGGSDPKSATPRGPAPAPHAELVPGIGTITLRGTF